MIREKRKIVGDIVAQHAHFIDEAGTKFAIH